MSTLPAELKAKWIAALRSGEYVQGHTQLRSADGTRHCCLGVLCVVAGLIIDPEGVRTSEGNGYVPINALGLLPSETQQLYIMNDEGGADGKAYSFADIADHIEKNL